MGEGEGERLREREEEEKREEEGGRGEMSEQVCVSQNSVSTKHTIYMYVCLKM